LTEPLLGMILLFPYDFAPRGWLACDGRLLPFDQNQALFSLLGTRFVGDGGTTFGIPDLKSIALADNTAP